MGHLNFCTINSRYQNHRGEIQLIVNDPLYVAWSDLYDFGKEQEHFCATFRMQHLSDSFNVRVKIVMSYIHMKGDLAFSTKSLTRISFAY